MCIDLSYSDIARNGYKSGCEQMEIGGIMAFVFKVFLGNPTIMVTLITWTILVTLFLSIKEYNKHL